MTIGGKQLRLALSADQHQRARPHKENAMPRTKLPVPGVAEVRSGLWSNAIRAWLNVAGTGLCGN